ncbi:MAG: glycerate kinase [Phormidesmis sp. RL_2_1]|nr:glycerate kinase [Phormidesmis sp. RL_2_1]
MNALNPLNTIVTALGQGQIPSASQRQQLIDWELSVLPRVMAWQICDHRFDDHQICDHQIYDYQIYDHQISHSLVGEAIERRAKLLQSLCQSGTLLDPGLPLPGQWTDWIVPLWTYWLPLADKLDRQQRALGAPFIQGILGAQGTGKTTLTQILCLLLEQLGHQSVAFSIDDLYLTYAQRCQLQQADPRLVWRGPPGTHDIDLGVQTLKRIKQTAPCSPTDTPAESPQIQVPRFDKSLQAGQGDRIPSSLHPAPTITLFEGWFVGARPVADSLFTHENTTLPAPIITASDRQFARDCNHRLQAYLPLWEFLDSLIVLYPEDYRLSQQWRQHAERAMQAQGKPGLCEQDIADFVTYFWKALHPELFITPLTVSAQTSLVVNIRPDHSLGKLYSPGLDYGYSQL